MIMSPHVDAEPFNKPTEAKSVMEILRLAQLVA
jgi:hypothetical protein